jgi:hypothetical protein
MVRLVQNDLVNRGVVTSKGRVRSSFTKLLETFDRWDRFAQRIGIDRKARYVDPLDVLRAAVEKANR